MQTWLHYMESRNMSAYNNIKRTPKDAQEQILEASLFWFVVHTRGNNRTARHWDADF